MNFYETEVSNKVIPKLILSKKVNNKKCAPTLPAAQWSKLLHRPTFN